MTRLRALAGAALLGMLAALPAVAADTDVVSIGSKAFTESVVLGEIVAGLVREAGARPVHRRSLGGTRILWEALRKGEIDVYPEYTGTIVQEILAGRGLAGASPVAIHNALEPFGIAMTAPLGFNNTYAIGVTRRTAKRYGLERITDLRRHRDLVLGFSNEFMDRADGWPALRDSYRLPHRDVRGLDHDLAYRGLAAGDIDATDVYTTDAEIAHYDLKVLEDDGGHFPAYDAVLLYRRDFAARLPEAVAAFRRLEGAIDASRMAAMNADVKLNGRPESMVAAAFLGAESKATSTPGLTRRVWRTTLDHLALVAVSLGAAICISVPLGILAARRRRLGQAVLGAAGIVQTIPSLALFVFMIPLLGIGGPPAAVALFLYSLLPIVRNTHAGLTGIDNAVVESAAALGLAPGARLRLVELPLAAGSIMAGIKTSAVINVGTATLGALIGAGGYGQPILTGIRLDDTALILEGAVPAALLALAVQGVFELAERAITPRPMRRRAKA